MVSRPTHKPIPIPLSVPVEDSEPFDSVDDLLASIRELVSPGAVDIIDLNRPVQPDKGAQPGPVQSSESVANGLGTSIKASKDLNLVHNMGEAESFSSESFTTQMMEKRYLSEKTRSESAKVLSSLMSALEGPNQPSRSPHTGSSTQGHQEPAAHHRDAVQTKGICLEDLVAQCLKAPLSQWIDQNDAVISQHVKTIIEQHITELLHQWLDEHLPGLIKASVDQHLKALIHSVRQ
jgi:cell pole-organizing protein PopZ